MVKPNSEGSSIGVKICENQASLKKNIEILHKNYDTLLVENFIWRTRNSSRCFKWKGI